jgi:hypothetical protein
MTERQHADITKVLEDSERLDTALRRAVEIALLQHKQAGNPIAAWRDGKVVWIAPDQIPAPTNGSP